MPYTEQSLPWSGRTVTTRHTSYQAAQQAQAARGAKTARYLEWLAEVGQATDQGAAECLGWPLSSINSIRNGCGDKVRTVGITKGRYGRDVAIFARAEGNK